VADERLFKLREKYSDIRAVWKQSLVRRFGARHCALGHPQVTFNGLFPHLSTLDHDRCFQRNNIILRGSKIGVPACNGITNPIR